MIYVPRLVDTELAELMSGLPAVVVEGAKGVGKTETAKRRAESVYLLDDPEVAQLARSGASASLLGASPPVLLDEWQRVPALWDSIRRAVDEGAGPGTFLLTGSASAQGVPTHSAAGRIVSLRMRPMTLFERGIASGDISLAALLAGAHPKIDGETEIDLEDYVNEIVVGGFPGFRDLPWRVLRRQLDGYIDRIITKDFSEQGRQVRRPETLRRWMTAYAAATSTTAKYEVILNAASAGEGDKPARTTTLVWRDMLERLWIIDPVLAWLPSRNQFKRLVGTPKHQLVDPAIATRLLGMNQNALLSGTASEPRVVKDGTALGHLFESLVVQSVRGYAQAAEANVRHLRTEGGRHEIDLIVENDDHTVVALEVKLSATVDARDVRHLLWLRDELGDALLDAVVVTTGRYAFRRDDGIAVVPAALLGP